VELRAVCAAQREQGPAMGRLEELERSHSLFEARCEGLLLRAEGKERAARNAEQRERALKKSYENISDEFAETGDEPEKTHGTHVLSDDAPRGEAERVQSLRLDVETDNKAIAKRAKWGR